MNDLTAPAPLPTGPMPFTRLLDEAMRLVRRHFRAMYPPVAIPLGLLATVTAVLQALWIQRMTTEIGTATQLMSSCGTIVLSFVQIFVIVVASMALQKAAVDALAGRTIDMKGAWRFAVQGNVLGTLVLQGFAIMGSILACIVPVLYVAPLLSLVPPIMAAESVFGGSALSRSAELTRYNPQRRFLDYPMVKALGLMIVTAVISYSVVLVVAIPFQLLAGVDFFRQTATGVEPAMAKWFWLQVPSQILQSLVTVAVYAYSSFGYTLLFLDTRSRKEGADLAAEIDTVFGPGRPAGEPAP